MTIQAQVHNESGRHQVVLRTNSHVHGIDIAPKPEGFGSSVNGGELLFLALATCYCNDVYREAAKQGIEVRDVEVTVEGAFGGPGAPATDVRYHAKVIAAGATEAAVRHLLLHTDEVAEIQNTLRVGTAVHLTAVDAQIVG